MQLDEQHRQRLQLGRFEGLQEARIAKEDDRCALVEGDNEGDWDGGDDQSQQRPGLVPVHRCEQPVKSQSREQETDLADEVAHYAEPEQPCIGQQIRCRRGCVSRHEYLSVDSQRAEESANSQEQIPQSRDSGRRTGRSVDQLVAHWAPPTVALMGLAAGLAIHLLVFIYNSFHVEKKTLSGILHNVLAYFPSIAYTIRCSE
jgi:hypothetical protein